MVDQPKAELEAESADTQPASMPDADQKTPDPTVPSETSPSGEGQKGVEGKKATLPVGVKERTTAQFEKLKTQLAEERSKRVKAEQIFTTLKGTPQPRTQQPEPVGNAERQNAQLRQQVTKLSHQVQGIAVIETEKQEKEAFNAYPSLNPEGKKFNQEFHNAVSGLLTNSLLKGDKTTFKEAADRIVGLSRKEVKQAEKAGADKALEQLTPKEQAALEATGRSDKRLPSTDLADLQERTRHGDIDAIHERIKNLPKI